MDFLFYFNSSFLLSRQVDESGSTISGDLQFLFVGYILIILYLSIMLGRFSRADQKVTILNPL